MSRIAKLFLAGCCCALASASAFGIANTAGLDFGGTVTAELPSAFADSRVAPRGPARHGNPLWSIPLEQLSATRDRPIFSPSRRPPPTAAEPVAVEVAPVQQAPAVPEQPQLALLGTVVNGDDGLAVLLDQSTKAPVRIRIGADHQGWTLRQVEARSVTLQKGDDIAVLSFPSPSNQPTAPPATSPAQTPSTSPAPARTESPFLSPESKTLRMPPRQRSARRRS